MVNKLELKSTLALILISPFIGEGLSGSTPFIGFLNPLNFILLIFLYGFGALIIRELTIRWFGHNNWSSIFILGMVYGMIEEGLYLLSFFNPNWKDVGILGVYGRIWGINWAWTVHLILFHALFSITIPIILTYLLYPDAQNRIWIHDKLLKIVIFIFLSGWVIWLLFVTNEYGYFPSIWQYISLIVIVIIIIFVVKKYGVNLNIRSEDIEIGKFKFLFVAIITGFIYLLMPFLFYTFKIPAIVDIVLQPIILIISLRWLSKWIFVDNNINKNYAFLAAYGLLTVLFVLLLKSDMLSVIIFYSIAIIIALRIKLMEKHRDRTISI